VLFLEIFDVHLPFGVIFLPIGGAETGELKKIFPFVSHEWRRQRLCLLPLRPVKRPSLLLSTLNLRLCRQAALPTL
jgi:hypothetical protein